ncbi:protein of unknown function [Clostridium sp. DSM 8431]|uniref:DUF2383 domain-containing protein n=1 Tax=Clostridium sp. DSM 8431 TaxID=1761781 RepID=UPI0008EECCB4|nr:DUF2383 domain-containing protein [Clostridium sp. DSM 8431]SFU80065.1 protein of unknown function [Clostridium sp. DSM 8431]
MDRKKTLQEMNKFLKGIHMGISTFKDYLEKSESRELRRELTSIIDSLKKHEKVITKRIKELGGNASESIGIIGSMGQIFEKIKLITADKDQEILCHTIKYMEIEVKNGNKFIQDNQGLEESLMKDVKCVVDEYCTHLKKLQQFW